MVKTSDVVHPVQSICPRVGQKSHMTFKIEQTYGGTETTLRLIGRLRAQDVEELKKHLEHECGKVVLDLLELTLVDLDVVRFLNACENQGADIVNGSPYIRKWMLLERQRKL